MNKKLQALEANHTRDLVPLPAGKKTVGCRWVYKIKYLANGEIERYKTRLVAKDYTQEFGVDFHDTFFPVAKGVTVKAVFALAASKQWTVSQLDINNVFLHGDLDEKVYMNIPLGYVLPPNSLDLVCKLVKSLYGLRQASRQWNFKLCAFLLDGFTQSLADYFLFTFKQGSLFTVAVVYVDDILLTCDNATMIKILKLSLDKASAISDLYCCFTESIMATYAIISLSAIVATARRGTCL